MKDDCLPIETLERVAALPAGHADRAHLDACTKCQALLRMLREFTAPTPLDEADAGALEARLDAMVSDLVAADARSGEAPRAAAAPVGARIVEFPRPKHARRAWRPSVGFGSALAFAAGLAIVSAVAFFALRPAAPLMRGDESAAFHALAPAREADGVRLAWTRCAGAEQYRVVLMDRRMGTLATRDAGTDTTLVLAHDALPEGVRAGETLGWQVEALSGGDVIERTRVRAVATR